MFDGRCGDVNKKGRTLPEDTADLPVPGSRERETSKEREIQ